MTLPAWKAISGDIKTAFVGITNYFKEHGAEIISSVKETLNIVWQMVVSIFTQIVDSLAVFFGYIEPIWEKIKTLFMSLWNVLVDLYELLKPLLIKANIADHIIPIKQGGEKLDIDNLQSLCGSCHSSKSAKEGSRWDNNP